MRWFAALLICIAIAASELPASAVTYSRIDLGALGQYPDPCSGDPVSYSRVSGINNAGQLVGTSRIDFYLEAPFVWTSSSGMERMGDLIGSNYSPTGITDSGEALFAGGYTLTSGYYDMTSGLFTPMDTDYSLVGLNEDGNICANRNNGGYTFPKVKDQNGSWIDIDPLPSFSGLCRAVEMNESGQVCGTARNNSTGKETAFLWNGQGNVMDIGAPVGYTFSRSKGINDNGWVLGEAGRWLNNQWYVDAFMWRQDHGFTVISTDCSSNIAVDINDHNQIVGCYPSDGISEFSWVWDAANGLTELLDISVAGINDQGWIIGNRSVYDYSSALLLQPVPEPSSIWALLCGVTCAGGLMRRKR